MIGLLQLKKCSEKDIYFAVLIFIAIVLISQFTYADRQVTRFGITWEFDRNYTVGQFANGDNWIVGPVNIIGIVPPSIIKDGRVMNGSMVNPSSRLGGKQGYDSAMYGIYSRPEHYDPNLNVARPQDRELSRLNPLVLLPNSSLVSTISISETGHRPQIQTAAILTVLDAPASEESFRPPYCGSDKTVKFSKNQLNYSLLENLKPAPGIPGLATVERYFERPWLDHVPNWIGRYIHPAENMPDYGREMATRIGDGALMLHLNFTNQEKETLLVRFVQLGIDLYGIIQDGGKDNWANNGGHSGGRKWPILFAGLLLNDEDMKNIGARSGDYLYSEGYGPGNLPQDYVHFGEDDQTFYISDNDIYEPPYQEHVAYNGFTFYGHGKGDKKRDYLEYFEHHKGMPEWGIVHATNRNEDGLDWDTAYRHWCSANSWGGFVLAAHIMGVNELWGHNALFDYMDRFMQVQAKTEGANSVLRQCSRFTASMWDAYREEYGPIWTMSPTLNITAIGGSVTRNINKDTYFLGEEVVLSVAPDAGYEFIGWSGDLAGNESPVTVIMHANLFITANFAVSK
jgi:hypothetical protein